MKKYYKFQLNMKVMNVLCIVLFILAFFLFALLDIQINAILPNNSSFFFWIILIFYLFLHEIFHGIGFSLFSKYKKNIKFGVMLEKGVFYAMCQEKISKVGSLVSLVFPLFFLTILPLFVWIIVPIDLFFVLAIFNLIGAIGDISLCLLVLKLPKGIQYIDYDNAVGAYFLSDEDLSKITSIGLRCTEVGVDNESLVNQNIPMIYISKPSKILGIVLILVVLINIIINYI